MKKSIPLFLLTLILLLCLSLFPVSAMDNSGQCGSDLTWSYSDGVLTISGQGPMEDYQNPAAVPWYKYQSQLKQLILSEGLTHIGDYAFYHYENLENILFSSTLRSIGKQAFRFCLSLTDVTIPDGVTFIGELAFQGCENLESISVPDSVTEIEYGFLGSCSKVTQFTIPKGLTVLNALFLGTGLTKIEIPDNIQVIDGSFRQVLGLTEIQVPDSVVTIGEDSFSYNPKLTRVILGNSVKEIGEYAFMQCRGLEKIVLPDTVTTIDYYGFAHCVEMDSIQLSNSLTFIGEGAFLDCPDLTSIDLPKSVRYIGPQAFQNCTGLNKGIVIPEGVTSISEFAFFNCEKLPSIAIPDSVVEIGARAFDYCTSLKDIYYGGTKEQWERILIEEENTAFSSAVIHYNSEIDSDVPEYETSPWASALISDAASLGLIPSALDTNLCQPLTRKDFAHICVTLYETMSGHPVQTPPKTENLFTDTQDPLVRKAYSLHIVSGTSDTTFEPDTLLTREQAAVMLSSVYKQLGGTISTPTIALFSDDTSISDWAKNAVYFMSTHHIVSGVGNNTFAAKNNITGQEALIMALRMTQNLGSNRRLPVI